MPLPTSRAGWILIGGRSSRMGRDKALLDIAGSPLVLRIAAEIGKVCGSVTLVGDPLTYAHLGLPVVPDAFPDQGPLAGMEAALRCTTADLNLIVACDMPELNGDVLESLFTALMDDSQADCAVPRYEDGPTEPLCAVYRRRCHPAILRALESGVRKLKDALQTLELTYIPVATNARFANLNTPEDLRKYSPGEQFPHYIEFRHVYKTFDKPVLVDTNFYVDSGQTVCIIGRSGVGKSVSLGHIMGFLKPDSGRVIVAHEDITDLSETELNRIRRKVTMVFQSGALFDSLTVAENILFSLELRDDYDAANKEDVVEGLLKMVGIWESRDAYPGDLPTGFRRAVAIARALAAEPQCILYDEPTTMVDPIMSDHLTQLMLRLKKELKLTSVVVTHDLDLLHRVADRVVFLSKGRIAFFGPPSELYKSKDPDIQDFLELDKVIRGATIPEDDPFRKGLGGVANE